jgi:small subunit ribosomal protein S15
LIDIWYATKRRVWMEKRSFDVAGLIRSFGLHERDTGSPEVQVAILSKRIGSLSGHFKLHKKDNHSKVGLFRMVSRRKGLLDYLKRKSPERYRRLIEALGLRR